MVVRMRRNMRIFKKSRRLKNWFNRVFGVEFFLIFGFLVTLCGLYILFVQGFHSFDMAQNLIFTRDNFKIFSLEHGASWDTVFSETFTDGSKVSLEDSYVFGVKNFLKGVPIVMLGMCLFGYALGKLNETS